MPYKISDCRLSRLTAEAKLALFGAEAEVKIHTRIQLAMGRAMMCGVTAAEEWLPADVAESNQAWHPNICGFKSWFCDQYSGRLCIALQFCSLGSLRSALAAAPQKKMSQYGGESSSPVPVAGLIPPGLDAVQLLLAQLLAGLSFLHSPAVAIGHRDLNPDNLFLVRRSPCSYRLMRKCFNERDLPECIAQLH